MNERGNGRESNARYESILQHDFVEAIMQGARENLLKDGRLEAALFLHLQGGKQGVVPLPLPPTHPEKKTYFTLLGFNLIKTGQVIQEAVLIAETWFVEAHNGAAPLDTAPSEHPQRKEAFTLVGRDAQAGQYVFALQPFHRDSRDQPVFEDVMFEQFFGPPDRANYSISLLDYLFQGNGNFK